MAFSSNKFPQPFVTERVRLGLTQSTLAFRIGISRNMVIRNEQAQFPEPLPRILEWYEDNIDDWDSGLAVLQYKQFQHLMRAEHGPALKYIPDILGNRVVQNPVRILLQLSGLSVAAFCRNLCIHQALVYDILNHAERFATYPNWLDTILCEANAMVAYEVKEDWLFYIETLRMGFREGFRQVANA